MWRWCIVCCPSPYLPTYLPTDPQMAVEVTLRITSFCYVCMYVYVEKDDEARRSLMAPYRQARRHTYRMSNSWSIFLDDCMLSISLHEILCLHTIPTSPELLTSHISCTIPCHSFHGFTFDWWRTNWCSQILTWLEHLSCHLDLCDSLMMMIVGRCVYAREYTLCVNVRAVVS